MMPKRVLIAYDGSLLSRKAIEAGKDLAAKNDELEVHIISVLEPPGPKTNASLSKTITDELMDRFRPQMELIQKEFEQEKTHVITDVLIKDNRKPGAIICTYAKNKNVDVIIVGSRGLGKVKNIFLGSVSSSVLEHSECPVLVMK